MNIKSFDAALDFVPAPTPSKSAFAGLWSTVSSSVEAISEGIRLASDYKTMTARGVSPDVAVRKVFEQI